MQDGPRLNQEIRPWQHVAIFLLAYAILIARKPDAIFHAQFFAEDGHVWFADAYNFGWWQALFRTLDGYFQTLPRLGASIALLVPLSLVPLTLNLISIAVQALPANLLLCSRSSVWGSLQYRVLLAGIYLALPNCTEISWGITEAQWPLAFCAFLLLVAATPKSVAGQLLDLSLVLLCGLTGPFCALLLPVTLILAWKRHERRRLIPAGVLAACCLLQAWELLVVNPSARSHYAHALGASPGLFVRILAGHVYLGALLGGNQLAAAPGAGISIFLLCIAIGGTAILITCFIKAPIEMKLFLGFAAILFAVSLASPNTGIPTGATAWGKLAVADSVRYWYFPSIAFAWSLLWCFRSQSKPLRVIATPLVLLMCLGVVRGFSHKPFTETHLAESVQRFDAAPPGTSVVIPEYPDGWTVQLIKHPSGR